MASSSYDFALQFLIAKRKAITVARERVKARGARAKVKEKAAERGAGADGQKEDSFSRKGFTLALLRCLLALLRCVCLLTFLCSVILSSL